MESGSVRERGVAGRQSVSRLPSPADRMSLQRARVRLAGGLETLASDAHLVG